jgi:hypothetical protein
VATTIRGSAHRAATVASYSADIFLLKCSDVFIINSLCPYVPSRTFMANILKITGQEINHALRNVTQQYLV